MRWVLDASAGIELLISRDKGLLVASAIGDDDLYAPQLLSVEVMAVLRRRELGGVLGQQRAEGALDDLRDLGIHWLDMDPLIAAAWTLRNSVTGYDAMYVAAARALSCRVLTCDQRLARAAPHDSFLIS